MERFEERLKELRLQEKLTQAQLGEKIGYSVVAVSYWESGKREPDIKTLIKIAKFFDVTVGYLLGVED